MTLDTGEEKDFLARLEEGEGRVELHFKPLTTGLGFEHPGEKKAELIKKKALRRQFRVGRGNPLQVNPVPRGELAPFYGDDAAPPTPQIMTKITPPLHPSPQVSREKQGGAAPTIASSTIPAQPALRVFAYLVDLMVLALTMALTLGTGGLALSSLGEKIQLSWPLVAEMKFYLLGVFACYYLFYFTFMDRSESSSVGKALTAIRVCNNAGDRANMGQILLRTVLGVLDAVLLGLPCLLNLKEHLSETRVIRCPDEQ